MRLIDADVMHREIDKYDPEGRMSLKNIKRYIDAQPTAYDIDKVAERLKQEAWSLGSPELSNKMNAALKRCCRE